MAPSAAPAGAPAPGEQTTLSVARHQSLLGVPFVLQACVHGLRTCASLLLQTLFLYSFCCLAAVTVAAAAVSMFITMCS